MNKCLIYTHFSCRCIHLFTFPFNIPLPYINVFMCMNLLMNIYIKGTFLRCFFFHVLIYFWPLYRDSKLVKDAEYALVNVEPLKTAQLFIFPADPPCLCSVWISLPWWKKKKRAFLLIRLCQITEKGFLSSFFLILPARRSFVSENLMFANGYCLRGSANNTRMHGKGQSLCLFSASGRRVRSGLAGRGR